MVVKREKPEPRPATAIEQRLGVEHVEGLRAYACMYGDADRNGWLEQPVAKCMDDSYAMKDEDEMPDDVEPAPELCLPPDRRGAGRGKQPMIIEECFEILCRFVNRNRFEDVPAAIPELFVDTAKVHPVFIGERQGYCYTTRYKSRTYFLYVAKLQPKEHYWFRLFCYSTEEVEEYFSRNEKRSLAERLGSEIFNNRCKAAFLPTGMYVTRTDATEYAIACWCEENHFTRESCVIEYSDSSEYGFFISDPTLGRPSFELRRVYISESVEESILKEKTETHATLEDAQQAMRNDFHAFRCAGKVYPYGAEAKHDGTTIRWTIRIKKE